MLRVATLSDEGLHTVGPDRNFNESMAFMFHEQKVGGMAGILRMGKRPNEGFSEITAMVILPDGGLAIHFERSSSGDTGWSQDGLKFEVLEPLKLARVEFRGKAHRLVRSEDLIDPKAALAGSPEVPLSVDLDYVTVAPLFRLGEGDAFMSAIASDHYQGVCSIEGRVTFDREEHVVHAFGWRDHSWGPRNWQGVRFWRWVSCFVDLDNYFAGWLHGVGEEPRSTGMGVVHRNGVTYPLAKMELHSGYGGEHSFPTDTHLIMTTEEGRAFEAHGTAFHTVPLRHRGGSETTRIVEIVCRQEFDGLVGYGFSEYLDAIKDGAPAGIEEA